MSYEKQIQTMCENTDRDNEEIAEILGCSTRTVRRYGGSYRDRMRSRSRAFLSGDDTTRAILLPDIHYPGVDWPSMSAVNQFMVDFNPHLRVYMGDQISFDSISTWNKNKPLLKESQRLFSDYQGFDEEVLKVHEDISPDSKGVFMYGNHEQRVVWYIESNPELEGMLEPEVVLDLEDRGYEIIPYNEIYSLGKLRVIHGYYYNIYHAAKTVDVFENSVVYAHVHSPQMHTKMSPVDSHNYHMATCLPCLSNIKPDYKKNAPTRWINGFGIVYVDNETGFFNLYVIIINKGKFIWNGKVYG
jgi:hypothetical protein